MGTLALLVTLLSTLAGIYVLLMLMSRTSRRRSRQQQDDSFRLVAEAGANGRAGMIRISAGSLEFDDRKSGDRIVFRMSDLAQIRLRPISLVRGTRMTLVGYDSKESEIAVTAPIEEVEQALTETSAL